MENRTIRISTFRHRKSGLLMATSVDLRGLVVHGRSEDELQERLPGVIKDLLLADGIAVDEISIDSEGGTPAGYAPTQFIVNASLADSAFA